jgi:molybdopterin synthase sulfur carrier subunit
MGIQVIVFGQLTDILKNSSFTLHGITDTDGLVGELNKQYPALTNAKYMIAVDRQTVTGNIHLKEGSTVALLPPFSGG